MRKLKGGSGTGHGLVVETELLKGKKKGWFPDDLVKIEDSQIHCVTELTFIINQENEI